MADAVPLDSHPQPKIVYVEKKLTNEIKHFNKYHVLALTSRHPLESNTGSNTG
jgi:hypothetical protein